MTENFESHSKKYDESGVNRFGSTARYGRLTGRAVRQRDHAPFTGPPALMILNEPETSLHLDLLPPSRI
jgi:hypothetical protein